VVVVAKARKLETPDLFTIQEHLLACAPSLTPPFAKNGSAGPSCAVAAAARVDNDRASQRAPLCALFFTADDPPRPKCSATANRDVDATRPAAAPRPHNIPDNCASRCYLDVPRSEDGRTFVGPSPIISLFDSFPF
jgi:hypothetical protein